MDSHKAEMHKKCGAGGVACYCCNDYKGKDKPKLHRLARRKAKRHIAEQFVWSF